MIAFLVRHPVVSGVLRGFSREVVLQRACVGLVHLSGCAVPWIQLSVSGPGSNFTKAFAVIGDVSILPMRVAGQPELGIGSALWLGGFRQIVLRPLSGEPSPEPLPQLQGLRAKWRMMCLLLRRNARNPADKTGQNGLQASIWPHVRGFHPDLCGLLPALRSSRLKRRPVVTNGEPTWSFERDRTGHIVVGKKNVILEKALPGDRGVNPTPSGSSLAMNAASSRAPCSWRTCPGKRLR